MAQPTYRASTAVDRWPLISSDTETSRYAATALPDFIRVFGYQAEVLFAFLLLRRHLHAASFLRRFFFSDTGFLLSDFLDYACRFVI